MVHPHESSPLPLPPNIDMESLLCVTRAIMDMGADFCIGCYLLNQPMLQPLIMTGSDQNVQKLILMAEIGAILTSYAPFPPFIATVLAYFSAVWYVFLMPI